MIGIESIRRIEKIFMDISSSNIEDLLFTLKLTNFDTLLLIHPKEKLNVILNDFKNIAISVMQSYGIHHKHFETEDEFLFILVDQSTNNKISIDLLIYEIYKKIQLHNTTHTPGVVLTCKIIYSLFQENMINDMIFNIQIDNSPGYLCDHKTNIKDKINIKYLDFNKIQDFIKCDDIYFVYQPIIEKDTGLLNYHECLLRFGKNKKNRFGPIAKIISNAEYFGANNIIDQTVLKMVVNELKNDITAKLSINISNAGFLDANLLSAFEKVFSENKQVAERLIVEITETSINNNLSRTSEVINVMREFGCKIALDDFGVGNTSFKQLQNLPVDIIKIDGSLIRDISYNSLSQQIFFAVLAIAKELNTKVVAECVENQEALKFLLDTNIDYMQGNFFSPALDIKKYMGKYEY